MYMFWICSSMDEHTYTTYMLGAKKKEKERKRKVMLFLKYVYSRFFPPNVDIKLPRPSFLLVFDFWFVMSPHS